VIPVAVLLLLPFGAGVARLRQKGLSESSKCRK
jgi:hypothetical protein